MIKKCKRQKKKRTLYHYLEREEEAYKNKKIKSLIDFDEEYVSSIKSLAAREETKVNLTRFLNRKMLMFYKTSIQSFGYDVIDVFMFPDEDVEKIYENNKTEKCFLFENLTDTDSTSAFFYFCLQTFMFMFHDEEKARDVIFDVLIKSKIVERLDLS